jgi:hypothetical protein
MRAAVLTPQQLVMSHAKACPLLQCAPHTKAWFAWHCTACISALMVYANSSKCAVFAQALNVVPLDTNNTRGSLSMHAASKVTRVMAVHSFNSP